jgi:hypothetical protein
MNDLFEQYRAQIECLQNELAKKNKLIEQVVEIFKEMIAETENNNRLNNI